MKNIIRAIHIKAGSLSQNPLFTNWLEVDDIAPKDKLMFTPMALDFIMGFRDFNKYYVKYLHPQNELEAALNAHAEEDETHSRLLLQDWEALEFDQFCGWQPKHLYWWLTCSEMEASRRLDFELIALVYHHRDPLLRFAIIESMEAAGQVFFTRTVPIIEALQKETGKDYPYYGKYHLDRETGHLQNADESLFFQSSLSPEQAERAMTAVSRVFEIFECHFTAWESFARSIYEGRWQYSPASEGLACAKLRSDLPIDISAYTNLAYPPDLNGAGLKLLHLRQQAFDELWQTPFCTWLRESQMQNFQHTLRSWVLQWIIDVWACADYFTFDTVYPAPSTPLERGINRLSELYRSEMNRRYYEWDLLQVDEYTGWNLTEALRYYWLDEWVDENRAAFADLRKLTLQYPQPLYRYWILKCFVQFGNAMMHSMGNAMRNTQEPSENFIVFAGYGEQLHPDLPLDAEADAAISNLERQPLTPNDVQIIQQIITLTKEQEARRLAISWRVIQENRFEFLNQQWLQRGEFLLPSGC